jgi:hypothetical protein
MRQSRPRVSLALNPGYSSTNFALYSGLILAALMIGHHFSISAR